VSRASSGALLLPWSMSTHRWARWSPIVVAILLPFVSTRAHAQSEPVATRPTAPPVPVDTLVIEQQSSEPPPSGEPSCWRAQPRCPAFFLTDIGIEHPVAATKHPRAPGNPAAFHTRLVWTIGLMGVTGRHAHGATVSLVSEAADRVPFMLEYRYRNWLGGSSALDLSLGYRRRGFNDTGLGVVPAKGFTGALTYAPNRWVGLTTRADFLRVAGEDRRAIYLGISSTRISEEALKFTLVAVVQLLLERVGFTPNENE
jgi:hypothetical protein